MRVRLTETASAAARRVLPPLVLFAMAVGVVWLFIHLHISITDARGHNYGTFVVGLAGAYLVTRVLDFLFFDVGYPLRRGTAAPALLRQLVSLLVFGLALGALFQVVLSASLPALLTTSAIITAVFGLALQETLGNFFSGLALAIERTVQVGDLVRSGETIGLVEQLSWRAIKVRTMEGNSLLVPNTLASRDRLEVFRRGGLPMARVLRVGLEYDLPPARARKVLESAARDVPGVSPHPAPIVYVHAFQDWAISYELRYWLEDYARFLEVDSHVRERVWYRLDREAIPFPYPVIRQHQYGAGPLGRPDHGETIPAAVEASVLFAPLSPEERQRISAGARLHRFALGETIVTEGESGSSMYVIAAGRVGVSVRGGGPTSQRVAVLEPGAAFGEISLLTGEPRLATIRALDETTLVEIEKATLLPLLHANPALVDKLDEVIGERRKATADRLDSSRVVTEAGEPKPLRARIAEFFGLRGLV